MLVQHFLENSALRMPLKEALIYGNKRLKYQQVNQFADRMATGLLEMGIKKGDRVAIYLDNSTESVIAMFGVMKVGGVFMMLNATMKARKLAYILRDSGAFALISHKNKQLIIQEAISDLPELRCIIWTVPPSETTNTKAGIRYFKWNEIIASSLAVASAPKVSISDEDLATIIYTSGSTGEPKGVMSTHYNVFAAASAITTYLENTKNDVIINALPLSFDYGLYQILMAFLFGGTVVLEKAFTYPYRVVENLVRERVTGFPIVPTMAALLLQMEISLFDFKHLRYITNTAAALPVAHIRRLQALFPRTKIYSMYGLTECKRVSYLPPNQLVRRPDSVGIPIPNERVYVVDEDGNELGPNEVGELVVRGPNVMKGYWNAIEETQLRFKPGKAREETLLYTGDLFRRDEEGYLYFVARKDDMIKTKGERVSPKEIENCLCELEGIIETAVIGVPDEIFGQAIKVFAVANDEAGLDSEAIIRHCKQNLEPFMVPKYVELRKSLPKSASGKIDKKKLK
jgi:amino acid adenylation domain-containing protein